MLSPLPKLHNDLVVFFGADKSLPDVMEGDADDFREFPQKRLAEDTVRRHCGRAPQLFRAAIKHRLTQRNPFAELK